MKFLLLFFITSTLINALEIIQKPINFSQKRIDMTKVYLNQHYGLTPKTIKMQPKIIVLHYTALDDFNKSFERFNSPYLPSDRPDIASQGRLNVSAHFLIDRNGTIYQLMPDNFIARHVIGLNYTAIGIENVGGEGGIYNLTPEQERANIALIKHLQNKYPSLRYLIGHSEYQCFESSSLWLEINPNYRTIKHDPGEPFLQDVKRHFSLLKSAPCDHHD